MFADTSSADTSAANKPAWHDGFMQLLPDVYSQLRFVFRGLAAERREDAIAECLASAAVAYARLHEQGKAELAFATPLAQFAARQFRAGWRVGGKLNGNDVMSHHAQRHHGIVVERLDRREPNGQWKEILVEDRTCTPADLTAIRIDFANWLTQLTGRGRQIAKTLATGETTKEAAKQFELTMGRISQVRGELKRNWERFQGEAVEDVVELAMAGC
jgi:hypothetical protein